MYGDPLTPLERDVIATLLRHSHPVMDALRAQSAVCRIKSRQRTGVGFDTDIIVPQALAVTGLDPITLTDVHAEIEGLEHGAGFALWIRDGMLDSLEGFTYDGKWPDEVGHYVVRVPASDFQLGTTDLQRLGRAMQTPGTDPEGGSRHAVG